MNILGLFGAWSLATLFLSGCTAANPHDAAHPPPGEVNTVSPQAPKLPQWEDRTCPVSDDRCFDGRCHLPLAESLPKIKIPHAPLKDGACGSCHRPTGEGRPRRRTPDQVEALCAGCHAEISKKIRESAFRHTPIDKSGCTVCHDPHGTDYSRLLRDNPPPPPDLWEYEPALRRFCTRDCHERSRYLDAENVQSGFRDGFRNLHAFHVNRKKGRDCKACHDVHASGQPFHIRPKIPFGTGGWQLPISYTRTDTGGSCVVGCHRPQSYSREKPRTAPANRL